MATSTVVDDRDSSIQYVGSWISGGSKSEYNSSLHGTTSIGAQAIFRFRGSGVAVFGTLEPGVARTPTSSYSIDGSSATSFKGMPQEDAASSRQLYYKSPQLDPSKDHTLVITLTATGGNTFWLDFLRYYGNAMIVAPETPPSQTTSQVDQPTSVPAAVISPSSNTLVQSLPTQSSSTISPQSHNSSPISNSSTFLIPIPSMQPSSNASKSSSSDVILVPTVTTATTATTSSQTQSQTPSTSGLSSGALVGIAVGSSMGGLLLLLMIAALFYVLRRRAKARMSVISSRRPNAFHLIADHQDSAITPTSEMPSETYVTGTGYVVRGGLSTEKIFNNRPSDGDIGGQGQSSGQRVDNERAEPLPAYESEFGDTVLVRSTMAKV